MKSKFKKLWELIKNAYEFIKQKIKQLIKWVWCDSESGGSGGSGSNSLEFRDINLVRSTKDAIGVGYHRTGWPWVLSHLKTIHSNNGILFDDFFEQNFCYKNKPTVYKKPWVAIFHHPKEIPSFGNYRENLSAVFELPEFKKSVKNLKLAIALSDDLADWLRTQLDCKVISLKHPINTKHSEYWDYEYWAANKKLCQIGFYLRNTRLVEQVPEMKGVDIKRLWSNMDWLQSYDLKVQTYWENHFTDSLVDYNDSYFSARYKHRDAEDSSIEFALPSAYDEILRTNVIIADYFACSASNVILECIAKNTPIIINRLKSIEQYLGKDYPLFFNHPEEIPCLMKRVKEAHDYLKNMNKDDLDIDHFKKEILKEVNKIKK